MSIFNKKNKLILLLSVMLGAFHAVAIAFVSIALRKIVDVAMLGDERGFWRLFFGVMIYMIALAIIGFVEAFCGKVLLRNVTGNLRERIFQGVMNKKPANYYKCNSADYLSALVNDVKMVEENYIIPLLLSSQMVALFLTTLVILCYLSPIITVILIGFLLLMFLVPTIFGGALQKRQDKYSEKMAVFTSKAKDFLSGYEIIRGFFIGSIIEKKFQKENKEATQAKFRSDKLIAANESLASMLSTLSSVIVVFAAAYMVMNGNITAGTLLALIQLSSTFSAPVLIILQNLPKITGMKPVIKRLEEFFAYEAESEGTDKEMLSRFRNKLELENVVFGYDKNLTILNEVNLTIEAGKKYAVLGESGCGKTTMIKLLTGYSQSYQGNIWFDGKEARDITAKEFSRLIAVIHQNVYLFDTDIYHNISLDQTFSDSQWGYALERSGVNRFLDQLEQGIHTSVGENGNRLSGGQKQRVAVARALIRKTPILILDEGTSAVDQQTAYAIEKELLDESGLTLITITHHLDKELRQLYSHVIQMELGKIKNIDSHRS